MASVPSLLFKFDNNNFSEISEVGYFFKTDFRSMEKVKKVDKEFLESFLPTKKQGVNILFYPWGGIGYSSEETSFTNFKIWILSPKGNSFFINARYDTRPFTKEYFLFKKTGEMLMLNEKAAEVKKVLEFEHFFFKDLLRKEGLVIDKTW